MHADHTIDATEETVHYAWDNSLDPVLEVDPGDVVTFECRDATDGQLGPSATVDDLRSMTVEGHALTGPVAVDGAEPGDTLAVDFLDFDHHGWGVSYVVPGEQESGLLPEEFPDAYVHTWDLDGDTARFDDDVAVPIDAFPGCAGVAPGENGAHSTIPPRAVGGNLDIKHLSAGSTLYLPVEVPGGSFSTGDCHAAQGDGEVCLTGIEAPMDVTARLRIADRDVDAPSFETTGPFTPTGADEPMFATSGVRDDLMDASKVALSRMLDHLEAERGLSRPNAYVLASAAVDLKINQVVDAPNWTVSAYLPESLFR
ncbi:acetamidase/formamidase family protein [Halocalculus aciditolerans]|uniref:Acetamidase n=1 Tax=Halocalculus aciditolerans TaxID=1383812 RepID=A0A830FBN6_9EURY|nr:acetamidase/formamidase family protein [Halocalculus aciditolerans]GGL58929.1 acetamidase [Halocalculus aciditolerans]